MNIRVNAQVTKSGRFATATCWCNKRMRLPVAGGGMLELEPDEFVPYEFSFGVKSAGEEVDYLRSTVRLSDEEGAVWEGESIWTPSWFVGRITDFDRTSFPEPLNSADAGRVRALDEDWFIRGARDLLDDRFHRNLFMAGQRFVVPFKRQALTIDLAAQPDDEGDDCASAGVVVKVSGLYALASEESREQIQLPPIVFTVDVSERLFVNYLFEEEEGAWGDQEIPEIVSFRRTNLKSNRNGCVRFVRE